MRDTFSHYPKIEPVNKVFVGLDTFFVIFGVLFNTYCLLTREIETFAYVAPIALLVAFPLGTAGFTVGLIARWGGFAGRRGEIAGLLVLGTAFFYIVSILIFASS